MANHKEMYLHLFRTITKPIQELQDAQAHCEELLLSEDELAVCMYKHSAAEVPENADKI